VKILCALSSPEYLRFYDGTIALLARRGHDVAVAVSNVHDAKPVPLSALQTIDPGVTAAGLIPERGDRWIALARAVRGSMDFVRYLHPRLAHASALRARMLRKALPWVLRTLDRIPVLEAATVERIMQRLARVERAIPISSQLLAWLDTHRPDALLISPLVEMASDQVDLVRAAQSRGIRVGTLIASWDNLTNKGDLRVATDRIFVWNESQKREAVELHRVDADRVVVTGAQAFDRWFERRPSRTREAFCRDVGLPDARPFVLYTGSSIFIARAEREMPFVQRWIDAFRAHPDPSIRNLNILVRPHPYNGQAWEPERFDGLAGVAVWPRGGYDPTDAQNRAAFFDSMFFCEAVVGINTSAMIESAIVGRPVLSITPPEFAGSQSHTLHFHHLLPENGGFVRTATTLEAHLDQLAALLRDREAAHAELTRFVGSFIRPHGLDRPAAGFLADAIEDLAKMPAPLPVARTAADRVLAVALLPLTVVARWFPPEGSRRPLSKEARHWRLEVAWAWRDTGRWLRDRYGRGVRRARRVRADGWRLVRTSNKYARHAMRQARYRAGMFARRLRGAPQE
jgi:hypothetical protein